MTRTHYAAATLETIRAGVDLVELVGRVVVLTKAGTTWRGLCPFHGEKTASFIVTPARGTWRCFGCGAGGDVFGWLMRVERCAYPDAIRRAAQRAGVVLDDAPTPTRPMAPKGERDTSSTLVASALRAVYRDARRRQAASTARTETAREILHGSRLVAAARQQAGDPEVLATWERLALAAAVERDLLQLEAEA